MWPLHTPRAMLRRHAIVVSRPTLLANTEGDPTGEPAIILTADRGTWRALSASEVLVAAQRGENLQAELAVELGMDIQTGDFVTVLGISYQVAEADPKETFRRCTLRQQV